MSIQQTLFLSLLSAACLGQLVASGEESLPLIVGHRGASHDAPENTLAAFRLAWEQGADGVEGDFYLTKDGEIVCIHDATTKRTAGVNHKIWETNFADLRKLDVGRWKDEKFAGERIPTLEEVLRAIPNGKVLYIELERGPEIVDPLIEVFERAGVSTDRYIIISFNAQSIAECEKKIPGVVTHWLTGYRKDESTFRPTAEQVVRTLKEINADGFGSRAETEVFDARFIQTLKDAGFPTFHVWTVNDVETARFYAELGAFGITTDRPAFIRAGLNSTGN